MKKILFICRYNILRSKIAAAYYNKINKNKKIEAISAGIKSDGNPLYKNEKKVAKEFGLKLSPKITLLSKAILDSSSKVILVADNVDPLLIPVKNLIVWKIKDSKEQTNLNVIRKTFLEIIKKVDDLVKKEKTWKT